MDAGSEGALASAGYAGLEASLATSAEAAGDINEIYQQVLGRAVDPHGLATYEGVLAQGGTLAAVQMDVAQSAEAAGVVQNFYQVTFGRAATADELVGMQYALGLTISDADQFGLYAANGSCLALTSSGNLLTQLPVAVTLDNGATPILSLPGGGTELFANATQLAAALLGLSLQQGQASVGSLSTYSAEVDWLVQIDQPMLQVAANLLSQAQLAKSEGNPAQVTLALTAYHLALQIAALPPAARGGPDWGLSASVQVNGHTTDVIVYNDTSRPYGNVVYHDKPNDPILGIVEDITNVIVDILAVFPATAPVFAPVATVLAAAEAGQGFAEGNVLGGVLQLANAVGFGELADGAGNLGGEILAASQAVGGSAAIVQSAENGDPLGAIAGALTIAAAAASQGIGINGNQPVVSFGTVPLDGATINLGLNVTQSLAALAAAGTVAGALNNGDVSSALITSLGTLFSTIADNVQIAQTTAQISAFRFQSYSASEIAYIQLDSNIILVADPDNEQEGVLTPGGLRVLRGLQSEASGQPPTSLPPNDDQLSHIFRDDTGHLLDTPTNRQLLLDVANDPASALGLDRYGNQWFARILPGGSQAWVSVRNGTIQNGGVNLVPRAYNPSTGLSAPPKG